MNNINKLNRKLLKVVENEKLFSNAQLIQLLKRGANPNFQTDKEESAIFSAVRNGNQTQIITLLDYGADINMLSNKTGLTPLCLATVLNKVKTMALLLSLGANKDLPSKDSGSTPLCFAATDNNIPAIELLVSAGANLNLENNLGTPLYNAFHMDAKESFILLLKSGAKYKNLMNNINNQKSMIPNTYNFAIRQEYYKILEDFDFNKAIEQNNKKEKQFDYNEEISLAK